MTPSSRYVLLKLRIDRAVSELERTKPRSRRRVQLELRLRDLVLGKLRAEMRMTHPTEEAAEI
jgi:hypothetical protein